MKKSIFFKAAFILLVLSYQFLPAQKVGFFSSNMIRDQFLEAKQANQRVQSIVEEWKRELDAMQKEIEALDFEIKKNRLIWSDDERLAKEKELMLKKEQKQNYAKAKFETGGEYDKAAKQIMKPVEEKIYAAVQEVSSDEGYDIIFDQSVQPLAYVNFKFDVTVKVLRKLGVDVDELEKDLQTKIDADPRNQKKESVEPRRRKRTKETAQEQDKTKAPDFEKNENKPSKSGRNKVQNPNRPEPPPDTENKENEPPPPPEILK